MIAYVKKRGHLEYLHRLFIFFFIFFVDTSDDITGVSNPIVSYGTTPSLTFVGVAPGPAAYIGIAAQSGGCTSPGITFAYASVPTVVQNVGPPTANVLCYSIDAGLTYVEQTTLGDSFVVG
jgi:hypothetical protein